MARPHPMLWLLYTGLVLLFYYSIIRRVCVEVTNCTAVFNYSEYKSSLMYYFKSLDEFLSTYPAHPSTYQGDLDSHFCRRNEMHCPSGPDACMPALGMCNGIKDCPDGSDEDLLFCQVYNCTWDDYQYDDMHRVYRTSKCPSGNTCTKNHVYQYAEFGEMFNFFVCSGGTKECVDGSDEDPKYCKNVDCSKYEYGFLAATCPSNNYCLYPECVGCGSGRDLLCDGKKDCPDGSDEWPSFCKTHGCSKHADFTFQCNDGGCVKTIQICNGEKDCADGSDENSTICASYLCSSSDRRKCPDGLTCFRQVDTCDGKKNCPDGSDERGCGQM